MMPLQAEMRLNARIFFSPLAPPHSRLRRLVETCGVLGYVAAPAPSDVFASVRSVLGDVVTRCSSVLGASNTIFKIVQILGASGHTVLLFLNIQYSVLSVLLVVFWRSRVFSICTQYPVSVRLRFRYGHETKQRIGSVAAAWRQQGCAWVPDATAG